jgi:hypothetical protein
MVSVGSVALADEDEVADSAFVKARVKLDDKVYEHPGFRINYAEENVLSIEAGGKTHEVVVTIVEGDGKKYRVDLEYLRNGASVAKGEGLEIKAKHYAGVKNGKLRAEVYIDPIGQPDATRKRKIEGDHGDNPLD